MVFDRTQEFGIEGPDFGKDMSKSGLDVNPKNLEELP